MRPVSHYFFDGYEIDQELLSDPVKLEFKMRVIPGALLGAGPSDSN